MEKSQTSNLIDRTSRLVERGSPAMRRAAFFIAQNAEQVVRSSLAEVSRACGTGESTVIRLCQTLGFDGFSDFKLALAGEIERERVLHVARDKPSAGNINTSANPDPRLDDIAGELVSTVQRSASRMNPNVVTELARKLSSARRVVAYGISLSGICAEVLAARLAYQGIIIHVPRSDELAVASAATLAVGDVAIGISYNGLSEETVAFLERARECGSDTYALTTQSASPLAKAAKVVLELSIFGAWPKDGSARLLPSIILLTEYVAMLIDDRAR
jgi:DNA-binding MurR/RpiR family transcriptional regulator